MKDAVSLRVTPPSNGLSRNNPIWSKRRALRRIASSLGAVPTAIRLRVVTLQRLLSMFPDGLPGNTLLVLRVTAGLLLIHDGLAGSEVRSPMTAIIVEPIAVAVAVLLLLGFWTPIVGIAVTVLELYFAISGTVYWRNALLLGVVGIALAVLGPGFRSVDARLYGRKRVDIHGKK